MSTGNPAVYAYNKACYAALYRTPAVAKQSSTASETPVLRLQGTADTIDAADAGCASYVSPRFQIHTPPPAWRLCIAADRPVNAGEPRSVRKAERRVRETTPREGVWFPLQTVLGIGRRIVRATPPRSPNRVPRLRLFWLVAPVILLANTSILKLTWMFLLY